MTNNFYLRIFLASLIIVFLCALCFLYLDRHVATLVQPLQLPIINKISLGAYYFFKPTAWLALSLLGFFVFLFYRYRGVLSQKIIRLGFICSSNLLAGLICEILKVVFARYRPLAYLKSGAYGFHYFSTDWLTNSMPSGHAAIAFSLAMGLSLMFRRFAVLFFLVVIFLGFSRVVINHHYVSDVILGGYIGIISALIMRHQFFAKKL